MQARSAAIMLPAIPKFSSLLLGLRVYYICMLSTGGVMQARSAAIMFSGQFHL